MLKLNTTYNKYTYKNNLQKSVKLVNKDKTNFTSSNINLNKAAQTALWFSKNCGEGTNIIINAIGKGALAPIVILTNPIVKEDKKTKQYSALKLCIDAITMLGLQLGLNKTTCIIIDNLAKKGNLGDNFNKKVLGDLAEKRISELKNLAGFCSILLTLPLMCLLISKITPSLINKINPELIKKENKQ